MEDLTTGQVAGIIAAGIFIVNIMFKLLWPLIMVAFMNMSEPATTWTKVGAAIQGSLWPTLLRSDSTTSNGVKLSVRFAGKMGLLSTLLLSLASIITPLGLYESIAANRNQESVEFAYARDTSVFGQGTLPRPAEGFSRVCGSFGPAACPESGSVLQSTRNSTGLTISDQDVINVDLKPDYMAYLQSGAKAIGPLVSSIFDIGYRTYTYETDTRFATTNAGKKYAKGSFNQFDTLFLEEDYQIVEGLVVDMKNGSIGFRNHTIPASASRWGTEWSEDLLFIEPQTECVNTNLTFEWTISLNATTGNTVKDLVLIDNGGFTDMNRTFPDLDMTTAQDDPQLTYRAYRSAWFQNAYTALYYNLTNPGPSISGMKSFSYMESELGKQIPMTVKSFSGESDWFNKRFSMGNFGQYITDLPTTSGSNLTAGNFTLNLPDNPWDISSGNFSDAQSVCNGIFGSTRANVSNILSYCGTALGIPQQKGPQSIVRFEPGTSYSQPLFGCASIMRAVIKTVTFRHNGTGIAGLSVVDIKDKTYPNEASYPLWAVETADMRVNDGSPLWGIVAPEQKDQFKDMTFTQKPVFYLPGYIPASGIGSDPVSTAQNLAGADFYANALSFAYSTGFGGSDEAFDYSGANSIGVYNRWAGMSGTPEGVAKIIGLIWADAAANSVVGTKSWVPDASAIAKRQNSGGQTGQALVPVYRFTRRVRYHIAYAIPAIIVLAIFGFALCLSFIMAIFGDATPGRMRVFLAKTSVGRVMTSLLHPDPFAAGAAPKEWAQKVRRMQVNFVDVIPRSEAMGQHPAAGHSDVYDPMVVKNGPYIGLQEMKR